MNQNPNLTLQPSSMVDRCPTCYRVVNKRTEVDGTPLIHLKHRGSEMFADAAIIRCLGCAKLYSVTAAQGIVGEMEITRASA